MERNVRLYPAYLAAHNALFWLPVFFLYLASVVSVREVLWLESLYYAAVVVLEVPSGYLSDRVGRRPTLIVAAALWAASGFLFFSARSFAGFAAAQVCLAAGRAFQSGTDRALLFDSLKALGREAEYGRREAQALSVAYVTLSVSAVLGGLLAGFGLALPYLFFALGSLIALGIAITFREPDRTERAEAPLRQLSLVVARARDPLLLWLLCFAVVAHVLGHVAYELVQPWLEFLFDDAASARARTPATSGILFGVTMALGAIGSAKAIALRDRFGAGNTLLLTMAVQLLVLGAMALRAHPLLVPLAALRSLPEAMAVPIRGALIQPRLGSGLRATWFSVESLVSRLAFSASLALCGAVVGEAEDLTPASLAGLILAFGCGGAGLLALFVVLRPRELRGKR